MIRLFCKAEALNCKVEPRVKDAVPGLILTVTGAGGPLLLPPPPQAVSPNARDTRQKTAIPEDSFRKRPMSLFFQSAQRRTFLRKPSLDVAVFFCTLRASCVRLSLQPI